jgi:L-phenylalanine/L-methionine N-acetyltransferase
MNLSSPPQATAPITLRRAVEHDAEAIAAYCADERVFGQLLQMPFPSVAAWRARLAAPTDPVSASLSLVAEREGAIVGSAALFSVGPLLRRQHVMGLGISVAVPAQGQGVGTQLMTALLGYADRWTPILRIELTVFADNAPAIALYRRFGFEEEGRMRAYALRDGVHADCVAMARLRPGLG